ncbi:hypothetical protein COU74_00195 [Candidatus Peregrinibacteria bacterium CG10_big_fil_rev_8_21_14_0_10_36_19]|nr:MAG: hypothetical protein COU74_00195 [Candidatus Peregrinibacteria bacterium CG10_big_fil_rev_8_21_14_0_10_36_19]
MEESRSKALLYAVIIFLVAVIIALIFFMNFDVSLSKKEAETVKSEETIVEPNGDENVVEKDESHLIEITSPSKDLMTFNKAPILFEGKVAEGVQKIQVISEGVENEHVYPYTDDYTLKNFKAGDRTFTYRVNTGYNNLKAGRNNYKFIAHFEDGKKAEAKISLNYVFDGEGVIAFDGCGDPTKYKNQKWYSDLKADFNALATKAYDKPVLFDVWNNNFNSYGVRELCYAADSGVVILMSSGEYCSLGHVYRYSVASGDLAEASYPSEKTCATMFEFKAREGNIVPISGGFGDAGCSGNYNYEYDFLLNKITLKNSDIKCVDL